MKENLGIFVCCTCPQWGSGSGHWLNLSLDGELLANSLVRPGVVGSDLGDLPAALRVD
jgi:hypothetical protein